MFLVILSDHLMIESEVYLVGCNLAQTFFVGKIHFVNGFFKWCKVLQNTLVNKNISVSQIQDSLFKVRTKQTIHDLESSIPMTIRTPMSRNTPMTIRTQPRRAMS